MDVIGGIYLGPPEVYLTSPSRTSSAYMRRVDLNEEVKLLLARVYQCYVTFYKRRGPVM